MVVTKNSNASNAESDSMVSNLIDVDSNLAQQEAQLSKQLDAIREKRKSLQSVIEIFEGGTPPASAPSGEAASTTLETADQATQPESADMDTDTETQAAPSEPAPKKQTAKKKTSSTKTKKTQGRKGSKGSNKWQTYVKDEFQSISLPKAVSEVLERTPNDVVEVSDIIDAIFVDDIPKQARLNARDRLSNVLSVGLKNNKWYRGRTGNYSVSQDAAEASAASA